jgi:hypothetical protein
MNKLIISTQSELDAISEDFQGEIHITGELERITKHYKNALVIVYDNAQIINVSGNAQISYVHDNAQIRYVYGNAQISNVYGNAQISNVSGNAQIINVSNNAQISNVYDNAQISNVYGNAQISNVSGNAQISNVYGNAQIINVYGNAQIRYVDGNAQIRYVDGNAQISKVYGNAQISKVYGNAQISKVYGNVVVLFCSGEASIQTLGQNIISYGKSQTKLKIEASPNTTIVILDEINSTFDGYKKFYPFEVVDGNAILYKSVHKTKDGKFVSDKDRSFEYKIGETKQHSCNPSQEMSCTYGLHVSHKIWALRFGCSWNDMALIEVKVPINKIVVANDCDGKVRTSELTVIREVPEEEWYK